MPEHTAIRLYTDGASRGNPGSGGAGAVLFDGGGRVIGTAKKFLGSCTNNEAEYAALILGLKEARIRGHKMIQIFLDSELLVRQIQGVYRVKNDRLKPLMREVRQRLSEFDGYTVAHVPRSENAMADRLANEAIDDRLESA